MPPSPPSAHREPPDSPADAHPQPWKHINMIISLQVILKNKFHLSLYVCGKRDWCSTRRMFILFIQQISLVIFFLLNIYWIDLEYVESWSSTALYRILQGWRYFVGHSGSEHHPGYFDKKSIVFFSCWLLDCRKHDFYDSYTFCSSRHKIIPIGRSL